MADKNKKKPRHTHLVVPSGEIREEKEKDRLGREVAKSATRQAAEVQPLDALEETYPVLAEAENNSNPQESPLQSAAAPQEADRKISAALEEETPDAVAYAAEKKRKKKRRGQLYKNLPSPNARKKQKAAAKAAPAAQKTAVPKSAGDAHKNEEPDVLPPNAVRMPKRKKHLSPIRRRRLKRRIRLAAIAGVALLAVLFFTTGAYISAATYISEAFDTIRLSLRPGDGFPMNLAVTGFVEAEELSSGGFAVLGERDAAIVSSTGSEWWRVQHAYLDPALSAGGSRVVVYSRGGKEYTVESRTKTLASRTTDQEILFCEMSSGGWLAVVTNSRHRATLSVYDPTYEVTEPIPFKWTLTDEKPLMLRFSGDDRWMTLGCLSANGGALGSTLYMLHRDRDEVQATVRVDDALLLRMEYLSSGRILALFDTFAAVYNHDGEELYHYTYGGHNLATSDVRNGVAALVFTTSTQERARTVLLDERLEELCEFTVNIENAPRVLVEREGVYLLNNQSVLAYTAQGEAAGTLEFEAAELDLVYGGQPLLITMGQVLPIRQLLHGQADAPSNAADMQAASPAGSVSATSEVALVSLPTPSGVQPFPGSSENADATANSAAE